MKIKTSKDTAGFKPIKIEIVIESKEELEALYEQFNIEFKELCPKCSDGHGIESHQAETIDEINTPIFDKLDELLREIKDD